MSSLHEVSGAPFDSLGSAFPESEWPRVPSLSDAATHLMHNSYMLVAIMYDRNVLPDWLALQQRIDDWCALPKNSFTDVLDIYIFIIVDEVADAVRQELLGAVSDRDVARKIVIALNGRAMNIALTDCWLFRSRLSPINVEILSEPDLVDTGMPAGCDFTASAELLADAFVKVSTAEQIGHQNAP